MFNDIILHYKWLNLYEKQITPTETTLRFGEDTIID